MDIIFGAECFV